MGWHNLVSVSPCLRGSNPIHAGPKINILHVSSSFSAGAYLGANKNKIRASRPNWQISPTQWPIRSHVAWKAIYLFFFFWKKRYRNPNIDSPLFISNTAHLKRKKRYSGGCHWPHHRSCPVGVWGASVFPPRRQRTTEDALRRRCRRRRPPPPSLIPPLLAGLCLRSTKPSSPHSPLSSSGIPTTPPTLAASLPSSTITAVRPSTSYDRSPTCTKPCTSSELTPLMMIASSSDPTASWWSP